MYKYPEFNIISYVAFVDINVAFRDTHGYRGNSKCGLLLQQTLIEQLLCQKYNRWATVSV